MYSVFSTKIVIGDSIFNSSTGLQFYAVIRTTQKGLPVLAVQRQYLYLSLF